MNHGSTPRLMPVQTNTALYCQLHEAGHPIAEIRRAQDVYRACCKLFNGRYRKSERAFICHAVGAGSAVAFFDRRIEIILTAMLHAAYDSGQFPDGRNGPTERHRQWMVERVGADVEEITFRYSELQFGVGKPEALLQRGVPAEQRDLVLIALAHELDDLADGGLAIAPKYGRTIAGRAATCAALARTIGEDRLAAALEAQAEWYGDVAWMAELEVPRLEGYRIAPNLVSYFRLRRENQRGKSVQVF